MKTDNHTTPPSVRHCTGKKSNGSPCGSPPLNKNNVCFWHSDDRESQLLAARRGGLASRPRPWAPEVPNPKFASRADVCAFVEEISGAVTRGELGPNLANSALYGASIAARIVDAEALERLSRLERAIEADGVRRLS